MRLRWAGWLLAVYLFATLTFAAFVFVNYFSQSATNGGTLKRHYNREATKIREQWAHHQNIPNVDGEIEVDGVVKEPARKADLSAETDAEKKYWDQWAPINLHSRNKSFSHIKPRTSNVADHIVDIWSNNGLGDYLWMHLLHGELKPRPDHLYKHGEKTINKIKYRYRSDSSLSVAYLPATSVNVVLVLNGRSNTTVQTAISWLDQLAELDMLQNVGLLLIGDETCSNGWLLSYLQHKNSSPKFVFLVYDSPEVDNKLIHQFPLGVATYRNFPLASFPDLVTVGERRYVCNFMGTVYPNSSREHLAKVISSLPSHYQQRCFVSARTVWLPSETDDSLNSYVKVLKSSDLTLCPVGMNAESYRVYEAMSVGSVPVIEDVVVNRTCARLAHRLLKEHGAPVIYVKDWSQLSGVLIREQGMSLRAKERRRGQIIEWYKQFRNKMANKFTHFVETKFFNVS